MRSMQSIHTPMHLCIGRLYIYFKFEEFINLFSKFYIGAISNAIRKQGIDIINATQKGNKFSQHKVDN